MLENMDGTYLAFNKWVTELGGIWLYFPKPNH